MTSLNETLCKQCDDPVPNFTQIDGPWLGNPVLYMGRDPVTNFALKYQFCDADCLADWLEEVLGR